MTRRRLLFYSVLLGIAGGCGRRDAPPPKVLVTDSAGIKVVTSDAPHYSGEWVLGPEPIIEIAADFGEPDHYFFDVRGLVQFLDGRFVVGNSGTRELYYFDADGTLLNAVAGPGQGPGELQALFGLAKCADGQIAVQEVSRLSLFDQDGDFLKTVQVSGHLAERRASLVGLSTDCTSALLLIRSGAPPGPSETVFERLFPVYWASFSDGGRDTVGVISALDVQAMVLNGQRAGSRIPYGREAVWAMSQEDLIIGLARDFEVHRVDKTGHLSQIIRWSAEAQAVTEEDWAHFVREYEGYLEAEPQDARFFGSVDEYLVPEIKPPYARLLIDDEGRLWLQQYGRFGFFAAEPAPQWWVFGANGEWLGQVTMPTGLEVLAIGNGRVFGVSRDALDQEYVRVYAVPSGFGGTG